MPISRVGRIDTGAGYTIQIDAGADNSVLVLSSQGDYMVSRLGADGSARLVQANTSYAQFRHGNIETLSDGSYVLYATNHSGLGADMRVQVFGQDGAPASGLIDPAYEDGAEHSLNGYVLAATNDGGFVIGWDDVSRSGDRLAMTYPNGSGGIGTWDPPAYRDVRVRFFDGEAAAITPSSVADDDVENVGGTTVSRRAGDQFSNDMVTLAGGQSVYIYEDTRWVTNGNGNGAQPELVLSMQIMSAGNIGEPIQVDLGTFGDVFGQYPNTVERLSHGNAVALPDGNFAVLWTETVYEPAPVWGNYAFAGWSTKVRYFDASGDALSDPIEVVFRGPDHGNHSKNVWAEALPDGRIAIAYGAGVYGANGTGRLDAHVSILGYLGGVTETTRINQVAAQSGQVYSIYDLAARTDGTVELVYNDARGIGGSMLNHTVIERLTPGGGSITTFSGSASANTLSGDNADNNLFGLGGNDALGGGGGRDSLYGGEGNDRLNGGTGNDAMYGGAGDDTYVVDDAGDAVVEEAGAGTDTVESSVSFALGANVEVLKLTGGAAIGGTGNALGNTLFGNGAANLLDGGAGADTMAGGAGDDVYVVDNAGDVIIEKDGGGSDAVNSSVSFSLGGQFLEVLNLTGDAAINGTGNGLGNRIVGNGASNVLYGLDGNDRLDGQGGADTMRGGLGNDVFVVDSAGDVVQENAGEGLDTVEAWIGWNLTGSYVEALKLMGSANLNGTGNGLANELIGNSGNNVLNGNGGADTMRGGAGDDRYIVDNAGDLVVEASGAGNDTVEASVSFSLAGQYVEELRLTGSGAINGTGNGQANSLWGNGAVNVLNGGGGNDVLHGGLGGDTLTGGAGQDRYWFETAPGATNIDTITDFSVADDSIHLDRTVFAGIVANGALASGAFRVGTAAIDADDRILYDAATGNLWYDSDGAGGAAAVQFAKLAAGLALTAADFVAVP